MDKTNKFTMIVKLYRQTIPEKIRSQLFAWRRKLGIQSVHWFDANVLNMSTRMKKLHGTYNGNRCFIMGNGPSLNKMNLDLFKD